MLRRQPVFTSGICMRVTPISSGDCPQHLSSRQQSLTSARFKSDLEISSIQNYGDITTTAAAAAAAAASNSRPRSGGLRV